MMYTEKANFEVLCRLGAFLQGGARLDGQAVCEIARDCGVSEQEAALQMLGAECGFDTETAEGRALFEGWLRPGFHLMDPETYRRDAYLLRVPFQDARRGRWQMTHKCLEAFEVFVSDDLLRLEDGRELVPLGAFRDRFEYPAILQDGREWMTLAPVEINSMRPFIQEAAGRVVLYGLGLGYCLFHLLQKPGVRQVTVVERDQEVLDLFREEIYPWFPNRARCTLIREDALAYAKALPEDTQFVFGDIWHDALDGAPLYLALRSLERPGIRYRYWMENQLKARVRQLTEEVES